MGKLVGEYLRDIASVTSNQIVGALRDQIVLKDEGEDKLIGELLIEAGHVTRTEVDEALRQQRLARRSSPDVLSFGRFYDNQVH